MKGGRGSTCSGTTDIALMCQCWNICIFHQACTFFSFPLFCLVFLIIHPFARVVATATLSASSQTSGYVCICRNNLDVCQRGRPRSHAHDVANTAGGAEMFHQINGLFELFCRLYLTSKVRPSCKSCSRQMCFCVLLKLFSHACVSPCNYAVPVIVPFISSKLWNICRKASGVSTLFLAKKSRGASVTFLPELRGPCESKPNSDRTVPWSRPLAALRLPAKIQF